MLQKAPCLGLYSSYLFTGFRMTNLVLKVGLEQRSGHNQVIYLVYLLSSPQRLRLGSLDLTREYENPKF